MKSWLIRTSNNYIFGPLSKSKVIELYENGSLQPEDEVCCGNGFWFFVKEEELVQKHLIGLEKQDFNPVSEAMDVLTAVEINIEENPLSSNVEETQVIDLNKIDNSSNNLEPEEAEEALEVSDKNNKQHFIEEEIDLDKKKSNKVKAGFFNNTILNILIFILIIFALSIVFYRKRILRNILTFVNPISSVYAQTTATVKKKDFL